MKTLIRVKTTEAIPGTTDMKAVMEDGFETTIRRNDGYAAGGYGFPQYCEARPSGKGIKPDTCVYEKDMSDSAYALCEAVADIAFIAGQKGYYSGNSRADISQFIHWAEEFEMKYIAARWGEDGDPDYIDAVTAFVEEKLAIEAVEKIISPPEPEADMPFDQEYKIVRMGIQEGLVIPKNFHEGLTNPVIAAWNENKKVIVVNKPLFCGRATGYDDLRTLLTSKVSGGAMTWDIKETDHFGISAWMPRDGRIQSAYGRTAHLYEFGQ